MSEIIDFMKENLLQLIFIIISVIFLLLIINIKSINLNAPNPPSKLIQEVTVETFETNENLNTNLSELFCESYLGNAIGKEKGCNELTEDNCAEVSCCVFNNGKCVAGDVNGPIYKTDQNGKLITADRYYYLGKYM